MVNTAFNAAQKLLIDKRADYGGACRDFQWPKLTMFNWAIDWFDDVLATGPRSEAIALEIVGQMAEKVTFRQMSERSNRIANSLRARGIGRGDRILLMLGNVAPLWETMLAAMKLGAVVVPSTLLLTEEDLLERIDRAKVGTIIVADSEISKFASLRHDVRRISVGNTPPGWIGFDELRQASPDFTTSQESHVDDPILLYFTSGTTSRPKMVLHSQKSFPVGHLTTMYWSGLQPEDAHMVIGAPGWAGHTFTAFFAPWNAGAGIVMLNLARFDARQVLDTLVHKKITSFFAPPTVWRFLLQEDLVSWPVMIREAGAAGEPLNPEVIEKVRAAWGLTIRDGWGQSEATVQIGNTPGQAINVGSMGLPLPGCKVAVLDENDHDSDEGELALPMNPRPMGLMLGYLQEDGSVATIPGEYYHTGDAVRRNPDGTISYVGRIDDVFKSSDYRISPFELESVLIEHPSVIEAAVVPSPDALRLAVPKAFITLVAGHPASEATAGSIFDHIRERLAPYKRIRKIEFRELPKTVSGKIKRAGLRRAEAAAEGRPSGEFREEDFAGR